MEAIFFRKNLSEQNELIKFVFQNYLNRALNLRKRLANKVYQENESHNNFVNDSHNEKLNNSKCEINWRDNVQINIRQTCDHVKSCQPESSNYPSKNNSGNDKDTNNSNDK